MSGLRRSMLFIPGNEPGLVQNGGVLGADAVIIDLEDAVAAAEKDAARRLAAQALRTVDYGGSETVVRINPLATGGRQDIGLIVPSRPAALLIPKVQSAAEVGAVAGLVAAVERPGQEEVKLMALLETPQGIAAAGLIARADRRLTALVLGAEDYTAALGAKRTKEGWEIFLARSLLVNAAAAAGIQAIDTPYTDINDEAGLVADTELAKQLGFKGKLVINPRQIEPVHRVFNPGTADIEWAGQVIAAIRRAAAEGTGVVELNGKMIDAPVVSRARQIMELAGRLGLAGTRWSDE